MGSSSSPGRALQPGWTLVALLAVVIVPLPSQEVLPQSQLVKEVTLAGEAEDFSLIEQVVVSGRGVLAILQNREGKVVFYSASGEKLGAFGRLGEGPGEFKLMNAIGWVGDSLWASDDMLFRTTMIGPDRRLVRVTPFATSSTSPPLNSLNNLKLVAVQPGGASIISGIPKPPPGNAPPSTWPVRRGVLEVYQTASTNTPAKFVARRPATPCMAPIRTAMGEGAVGIPHCQASMFAVAPDGSRVAVVTLDTPFELYRTVGLTVISGRGDTLVRKELPVTQLPVSAAVVLSRLANKPGQRAFMTTEEKVSAVRAVGIPKQMTGVVRLLQSNDGTTWVEEPSRTGAHPWMQLSAAGVPVRRVTLASYAELAVAEKGLLWVIETDGDGLQSVVRYRVQ